MDIKTNPLKKTIVVVTGKVQPEIIPALEKYCEVHPWRGEGVMPIEVLDKEIREADGLVVAWKSVLRQETLQKQNKLKIIAQHFVGYENVDVEACTAQGIPFCNTASASINTVAELAMALLFSLARHIVPCTLYVARGDWEHKVKYDYLWGKEISGSTLGILGMGRIGTAVAQKAQCLGMHVMYHNRKRYPELHAFQYASLTDVYKDCDFIINTLPSTRETYHLVDWEAFETMKKSAFFINVGRGDTVNTSDLIHALQIGQIRGAAIDVAEAEPISIENPLITVPNLLITPHIGSETWETHIRKSELTVNNILHGIFGGPLIDCVNPEVLS